MIRKGHPLAAALAICGYAREGDRKGAPLPRTTIRRGIRLPLP